MPAGTSRGPFCDLAHSGGSFSGIRELIAVTHLQAGNANGNKLDGAEKQRTAGAIDLSPLQMVGRGAYQK